MGPFDASVINSKKILDRAFPLSFSLPECSVQCSVKRCRICPNRSAIFQLHAFSLVEWMAAALSVEIFLHINKLLSNST